MAEKKWFEEWFDSPYYHLLYSHRSENEAERFIEKISTQLNIPKGAKVLDVACGKGRHAKTLYKLGYDVTGIDLSPNSIAEARKCIVPGLFFEVWDMRKIYKPAAFDYVFNLFSSFGYFENAEDDLKAVQAFAGNLKPGGTLIFDYINTEWLVKNIKAREIVPRGETQFHIQKRIEGGFIKKRIDFLAEGENYSFEEQLKLINLNRFEEMFAAAGLEIIAKFGDYELGSFISSQSPRLILIARKT
ncbi:MAG: class I SAM-dependent methyltransferase [Chitinophagales bacterium]